MFVGCLDTTGYTGTPEVSNLIHKGPAWVQVFIPPKPEATHEPTESQRSTRLHRWNQLWHLLD